MDAAYHPDHPSPSFGHFTVLVDVFCFAVLNSALQIGICALSLFVPASPRITARC